MSQQRCPACHGDPAKAIDCETCSGKGAVDHIDSKRTCLSCHCWPVCAQYNELSDAITGFLTTTEQTKLRKDVLSTAAHYCDRYIGEVEDE